MLDSLDQVNGNGNGNKMDFKADEELGLKDLMMIEVRNSGLGHWVMRGVWHTLPVPPHPLPPPPNVTTPFLVVICLLFRLQV